MASELFFAAVKTLADRNMSAGEVIEAAAKLKAAGGSDLTILLYKLWIQQNADAPLLYAILFNYAVALSDSGDIDGARQALERSVALNADFYPSHINLAGVHERAGAIGSAITQWLKVAERLAPVTADTIGYKSKAFKDIGRVLEAERKAAMAEDALRQSLDLNPAQRDVIQHFISLRLNQCKWPAIAPWERVGREALLSGIGPLSAAAHADDPMFHLAAAWNESRLCFGAPAPLAETRRKPAKRHGRLKIGYLSSDLREHAVGFLMAGMFELHDRKRVEVFAYYCGKAVDDGVQRRIKAGVEHWIDLGEMDAEHAARRIAEDGIDILVDVNGHTKDARPKAVALRPAPIQVNWLGYPGSMGTPYHHYIIADDFIIPPESEIYYAEKVVRLPCYQPNDRQRELAPNRPSRQQAGLPETAMVYCSFNGVHKISRHTFDRWMEILKRVPDSVLWLLDGGDANASLRASAESRGVAPDRLVFATPLANPHHLVRYPLADLFLDSAPYGAHTTASDALWMGVPVLTVPGRGFAARVCGSLVRAAGQDEMICETPEDFVELAVALGTDRARLKGIRDKLEANRDGCVLFDTPLLVKSLEGLYEGMWKDYASGNLPRPDLANLDAYLDLAVTVDYDTLDVNGIADYQDWYRQRLAERHRAWPIPPDRRLWTEADIAAAERTP